MKNLVVISLILSLTAVVSCSPSELSPEEKQRQLETYRKEYAELKTKIEKLETELAAKVEDPKAKLRKVEVIPVNQETFEHFIEVQGTVQSKKNVMVNPEVGGIILRLNVQEGQEVKEGQVIAEIDAELVRRNLSEVKKRLELATTVFQRQENLWKQQIGSEVQYLQAKNEKEALEKSIESIEAQLKKAVVRAPISGVLDQFFLNQGEMAVPSMPLARIVNLALVEIVADVSEAYLKNVRKGDLVGIKFPVLGMEYQEKVSVIGQFISPENRTFRIEIQVDNKDRTLKPNMLAVVKINDFKQENALSVPSYLVQRSTNGEKFLFKVEKESGADVVKKVALQTGMVYQGKTHVISGLAAGDRVISKGFNEVINNEEVNIVGQSSNLSFAP